MSKDHLKLPSNFVFDKGAIELMKYHLGEYIVRTEQVERWCEKGITIYLSFPLKIVYKRKWYWVAIVCNKEDKCYFWYLRPYKKSYFTTYADENNTKSFEMVIQAINDNEILQK